MDQSQQRIEITFLHPRTGDTWPVRVSPELTGGEALAELTKGGFFSASGGIASLALERTGKTILSGMTLADAGIAQGDRVAVIEVHQGARAGEALPCPR